MTDFNIRVLLSLSVYRSSFPNSKGLTKNFALYLDFGEKSFFVSLLEPANTVCGSRPTVGLVKFAVNGQRRKS